MTNWAPDATSIWDRHSDRAPAQSQWKGGELLHCGTLTFRPDISGIHNLSVFFNDLISIARTSRIVHQKMIILSFTHPQVVPNQYALAFFLWNTKVDIFEELLCSVWHITIVYSDHISQVPKRTKPHHKRCYDTQ